MTLSNTANKTKTQYLILTAMMTAFTAICAVISVPLPFSPVPVSLATLAVLICGGLLGPKYGSLSQIIYLLLGAVGVPIFHSFTGGMGILLGPTGGFLFGYIFMAFTFGLLTDIILKNKRTGDIKSTALVFFAAVHATITCYIPGLLWFMVVTGNGIGTAASMAVLPFIPVDLFKCIVAALLVKRLTSILPKGYNIHI